MTLHAYQKYDAAAQAYQYAHFLKPQQFDWLYLLGEVQMERGDFEAAVTSLQSAFGSGLMISLPSYVSPKP